MPDEVSLVVSTEGLMALADMALASKSQSRLEELLAKNVEGELSAEQTKELDLLLMQVDELNLVKAHAAAKLHQMKN
ncbi:MAG: hypothetical protein U0905_15885 [Pirellulales bacterium]